MQTFTNINTLLFATRYKDWEFIIGKMGGGFYLQYAFTALDVHTEEPIVQKTRKWYVSKHMTDSEVIQTAFLAIKTAEEHEMREQFTFDGQRLFGPHMDLKVLANFTTLHDEDKRKVTA